MDQRYPYVPQRLKKNKYTPSGPTLAGAAKCEKKGHRPANKHRTCTRCNMAVPA